MKAISGIGVRIPTPSGYALGGTLFVPEGRSVDQTLLISSATGVLQRFYYSFARHFSTLGYAVLTFDYQGIGKSSGEQTPTGQISADLKDWGANDQAAAVTFLKGRYPTAELSLLTHSIGGQLIGFNPAHHQIAQVVMVASQSGYWKLYPGWQRLKMWTFWHVLIPTLTQLFGYFPAKKLGLFEDLPGKMAIQWMNWGKHPDYMKGFPGTEHFYFDQVSCPMLLLSFPSDPFAPKATVDWLSQQYPRSKTVRIHYTDEGDRPGHFGYFKRGLGDLLWKRTANWLSKGEWA